jgi:hypothetical protein
LLIPIAASKDLRKEHESKRDAHQAECDRLRPMLEEWTRKRYSTVDTAHSAEELKRHRSEVEKYGKVVIDAIRDFSVAHRSFNETVMAETKAISLKVDQLIYSMRIELALVTSLEELQRSSAAQHAAAEASTQQMYASLE